MSLTKIEQLRQKYADTQINVVDLVRLFDPTKNKILTDILMSEFMKRNATQDTPMSEATWNALHFEKSSDAGMFRDNNALFNMVHIIANTFEDGTFEYLERFDKYWREGKIENRDIYSYKSWEDIKNAVDLEDVKEYAQGSTKTALKVYKENNWVVVMPLCVEASKVYGGGTRWCTTQRDNNFSFWKYSQDGLLFYIINTRTNDKYAYYRKSKPENYPGGSASEFYNAADVRIDSMDSNVPASVLTAVREFAERSIADGLSSTAKFPNFDLEGYRKYLSDEPAKEAVAPRDRPPLFIVHNATTENAPTTESEPEIGRFNNNAPVGDGANIA